MNLTTTEQFIIALTLDQRNYIVAMIDFFEQNKNLSELEERLHLEVSLKLLETIGKEKTN